MHSPGVPFREGEHPVSGEKAVAFAVKGLESRRNSSPWRILGSQGRIARGS